MTYLFDTTAVSALMRGEARVASRVRECAPGDIALPQPVIAEIEHGLSRLPRSRRKTALVERWSTVNRALARAQWTDAVSGTYGGLKADLERTGKPLDDFDLAIAAHALESGATLVTSNVRHFTRVPALHVEDWERG